MMSTNVGAGWGFGSLRSKATPWAPCAHLHGYEKRLNEAGYLETRPISDSEPAGDIPMVTEARRGKISDLHVRKIMESVQS